MSIPITKYVSRDYLDIAFLLFLLVLFFVSRPLYVLLSFVFILVLLASKIV